MKLGTNNLMAFPGDTYIKVQNRAAKARYAWASILILAMLFSGIVDLINISEILKLANDQSIDIINWLMALGISIIYIVVGAVSGNCLRLYKSTDRKAYLYMVVLCIVSTVAFLIVVAFFRNNAETSKPNADSIMALYQTMLYTAAMFLGLIASFVFGYFRKNALSEKLAMSAISHHADDVELYNNSKLNYISENFDDKEFNSRFNDVNDKIKYHLSLNNESKIKVLLVKNDPAEAKDVIDIANKINDTFYNENNSKEDKHEQD